jgi:dienelactone hydrolase
MNESSISTLGVDMRRALILVGLIALLAAPQLASAEEVYSHALPPTGKDLRFPSAPQPFGYAKANRMFKPTGPGPFPALVILPTCSGHAKWRHSFDLWAKSALDRGYAVLVVDPLTPRGAGGENCRPPVRVGTSRFRKDAFDAAEHLRKQSFIDRERIGLLGLSLGAMAGLGASDESLATPDGRAAFRAIVSIYPVCFMANVRWPGVKRPIDIRWFPNKVKVPLQVQLGELDTEAPPKDCVPRLRAQKDKGAPVEYIVHKNATHNWDVASLGKRAFRKRGFVGQDIVYRYNPEVAAQSVERAFEFLDRHVKGK